MLSNLSFAAMISQNIKTRKESVCSYLSLKCNIDNSKLQCVFLQKKKISYKSIISVSFYLCLLLYLLNVEKCTLKNLFVLAKVALNKPVALQRVIWLWASSGKIGIFGKICRRINSKLWKQLKHLKSSINTNTMIRWWNMIYEYIQNFWAICNAHRSVNFK